MNLMIRKVSLVGLPDLGLMTCPKLTDLTLAECVVGGVLNENKLVLGLGQTMQHLPAQLSQITCLTNLSIVLGSEGGDTLVTTCKKCNV